MRNGGSAVFLIIVVTLGLALLIRGVGGCEKSEIISDATSESISKNVIPDTVFAKHDSVKASQKVVSVRNGITSIRAHEPQVNIRNIGYSKGSYLCEYSVKNMNTITERYSLGYLIEERTGEGRFEEFLRLGDLDLGPVSAGASRNLDFMIPEFERKSGSEYRVKILVADPDKHRGEPIASAAYPF